MEKWSVDADNLIVKLSPPYRGREGDYKNKFISVN
jgi:hypothetical protein